MVTKAVVSVAIPSFNEGARLPLLVEQLVADGERIRTPAVEGETS